MIYTKKQLELMRLWQKNELKRINLLEGSVSSGKTWISLVLWAFWVKTMPRDKLYMMAAKSLTTLKRNCLILLQELVGESNFTFSLSKKEGVLFDRRILLEGANDARSEAKIRGLTLQGAYCDELTNIPQDFFTMLLSRLRLPESKLFATTNPDNPLHWLKLNYIDRKDELSFLDVKFLLEDNTTLPQDYIDNIKVEYTGVFYERFILGNWVVAEGLVYPMWESCFEEPPKRLFDENGKWVNPPSEYVLSMDYGTMNPFAALLFARWGDTWYAIREYYYSGRDTKVQKTDDDYANDIDNWLMDIEFSEFTKLKTIIDPSAASFIAVLQKRGKYKVIKANNDVLDGIRETANALSNGYIKISPRCANWKDEAGSYVWNADAGEDKPIKDNDHLMDAMRYFVKTMNIIKVAKRRKPDDAYLSRLIEGY